MRVHVAPQLPPKRGVQHPGHAQPPHYATQAAEFQWGGRQLLGEVTYLHELLPGYLF